jgi:glycerol-3-phosphate acyltransferase PlsY
MAIAILVAALVLVRHRSNVARLLKGDEHSVGKADGND